MSDYKVQLRHVVKVFGSSPEPALTMLKEGAAKQRCNNAVG